MRLFVCRYIIDFSFRLMIEHNTWYKPYGRFVFIFWGFYISSTMQPSNSFLCKFFLFEFSFQSCTIYIYIYIYKYVYIYIYIYVCVCVCVCERERERENYPRMFFKNSYYIYIYIYIYIQYVFKQMQPINMIIHIALSSFIWVLKNNHITSERSNQTTMAEIGWLYPKMHVKGQVLGNVFEGTFSDSFSLHPNFQNFPVRSDIFCLLV